MAKAMHRGSSRARRAVLRRAERLDDVRRARARACGISPPDWSWELMSGLENTLRRSWTTVCGLDAAFADAFALCPQLTLGAARSRADAREHLERDAQLLAGADPRAAAIRRRADGHGELHVVAPPSVRTIAGAPRAIGGVHARAYGRRDHVRRSWK
jgi:hypothetical protein